ncbi:hypothetical protein ACLQ2P_31530 [Actinomadura citrea]|uniref:hypothetical protein n=1 Tax=Actinomadura citrea TaxID=46158 RepID=UPI003CE58B1C
MVLRDVDYASTSEESLLISPEVQEAGRVELGRFDLFNHPFAVRHSPELFFLRGGGRGGAQGKQVARLDPLTRTVTDLFPLEWDTARKGHLFGGPAAYFRDAAGEALVHGGAVHNGRGLLPGNAFVARRALPSGSVTWVFTADHNVTSLDISDGTVYAAFTSGTVVALDAVAGAMREATCSGSAQARRLHCRSLRRLPAASFRGRRTAESSTAQRPERIAQIQLPSGTHLPDQIVPRNAPCPWSSGFA